METTANSRKGSDRESSDDSPRNDSYATAMESDGRNTTPPSAETVSTGPRPWPSSGHPPLKRPRTVHGQALDTSEEEGHSTRYSSMFRRNESRASNPSVAAGPNSAVARRSRRQLRTSPSTGRDGSLERKSTKRERFLSIDGDLGLSCFTLRSDPGSGDRLSIYLSYHPQETPTNESEVRSSTSNRHCRSKWESKSRSNEIGSRGDASRCSDWSRNREEWDNACPDVDEFGATGDCEKVAGPCNTSESFYHNFSLPFNVNDNKTNELNEKPSFFRDSPFARRLQNLVRGSGKCRKSDAKRNKCRQSDERRRLASEAAVSCERCNARRATKTRIGNEYVLPDDQPNVPLPTSYQNKATANNVPREAKRDESANYADMKQSKYKTSFPCQNEGDSFTLRLASDDLYGPRLTPVNFSSVPPKPAPEPKLPLPICKNQKSGSEIINRKLFCKRKPQNRKGETLDCRVKIGDLVNEENSAQSSELEMEATFQRRDRVGGDDEYVAAWEYGATLERRNEDELLTSGGMERVASGQTKENRFCRRQASVRCLGLSRPTDSLRPEDTYLGNWSDPERPPLERPHIERPPAERPLPGEKSNEKVRVSGHLKKSTKLYPEVDELVGESSNVELPTFCHGRSRLSSSLNEIIPFYEEIDDPKKGDVNPMQRKKKKGMGTGGKGNSLGRRFLNLMERLRGSVSKRKKSTGDD